MVDTDGDSADDPAIWIHPNELSKSRIIGTNKKGGLIVYDLQGKQQQLYPVGRVNNVDVRYGFPLSDKKVDIVAASNSSFNAISIYSIDPDSGTLEDISARTISSSLDVYGFCLYKSSQSGKFYAFVNSKSGDVEQWELYPTSENKIDAALVRAFKVGEQSEGCVADDEFGYLYIGEETYGIWKYFAEPDQSNDRKLIADTTNKHIKADIEGLTIYHGKNGAGYLLASIQGLNTYAVFERGGKNKFLGCFNIQDGAAADGVEDTDGIDVINLGLNTTFPNGFFIAQDGYNNDGNANVNQNFKLVAWENIATSFSPPLQIDNTFNFRELNP